MLLAQLSDVHIVASPEALLFGRVDTAARFRAALEALIRLPSQPDLILLSGDLVDHGGAAEYARLRSMLTGFAAPIYLMAGNHDDATALREAFPEHTYMGATGPVQYTIERFPVRIVVVDTVVPGVDTGELTPPKLQWLATRLAEQPDRPTLLAMHHPPISSGHSGLDQLGLINPDALAATLAPFRQVVGIVSGHYHRNISTLWNGIPVNVCPATAQQLLIDFRSEPSASYLLEPPGYQLHRWDGHAFTTYAMAAGDFPGPFNYF